MSTFENAFKEALTLNGLCDHLQNAEKFEKLFVALSETNKLYNLTAVTDEVGVCGLHFADSLMALPYIKKLQTNAPVKDESANFSLLDIGCGAGFPCLPIAIAAPEISVTGVDSTAKKTEFSRGFAVANGIKNFTSIAARAEELARTEKRESFDLVTARAVARLNILCELALPFLKVGGHFLALKGSRGAEELEEAKSGIAKLGGKLELVEEKELILPTESQKRTFILIKKVAPTVEKYPRMYSKIVKNPL